MRKNLLRSLFVLCISASAFSAYAQPAIPRKYVEHPGFSLGINFGMSDLWGDVGTQGLVDHYNNDKYFDKPTFMGGIFFRYVAHPSLGMRLNINYGTLYATDEWNVNKAKSATSVEDDAYQRYLRNQDARANVWEATFMFELMPLRWNSESKVAQKAMQPYLTAGVGGFYFRPQTSLIDPLTGRKRWVDTRDLQLEGDGIPNSGARVTTPFQVAVPVGLGLRWDIGNNMMFGFEYLYRFTTTDRLDNVSSEYVSHSYYDRHLSEEYATTAKQVYDKSWYVDPGVKHAPGETRGNKDVLDGYSTFSIQFIYRLETNKIPWWY